MKRHWTPNQKLTKEQIATIKHLKSSGVQLSLIAQVIQDRYGVSKCTAYYHASDNRDSYDYQARRAKQAELNRIKEKIYVLIAQGFTTEDVASEWNMPLATVNKIYVRN
jgi:DNA-binding NarL/FixJ family response regulator